MTKLQLAFAFMLGLWAGWRLAFAYLRGVWAARRAAVKPRPGVIVYDPATDSFRKDGKK
jgi:hypothetical protein